MPELSFTEGTVNTSLRVGYHTLFPFWESVLPEYRVRYSVTPRIRYEHQIGAPFYIEIEPNLLLLTDNSVGYELFGESGLSLQGINGAVKFYLWVQFNDEAELLESGGSASRQIGLGFRIGTHP